MSFVHHHIELPAFLHQRGQPLEGGFGVRRMMEDAPTDHEIEAVRSEWKSQDIGLEDSNVAQPYGGLVRHSNAGIRKINGYDGRSQRRERICPSAGSTARIQHQLALERLGGKLHLLQPLLQQPWAEVHIPRVQILRVLKVETLSDLLCVLGEVSDKTWDAVD